MRTWLALAALCLAGLAGCGGPGAARTPEISLLNIGSPRLQGLGGTCAIRVRLANPNPDPVRLEGAEVAIAANGGKFCKGMAAIGQELGAYEHVDIDIPGTLSNLALIRAGVSAGVSGKLAYSMLTTVTFRDAQGRRHSREVEKDGRLDGAFLKE